jgi:XTP/dITP diphosphohydrolase
VRLLLASNNLHKLSEFRRLFAAMAAPVQLLSAAAVGTRWHFEEGAESYSQNALGKALAVHGATGEPALADDSGIEVEILAGAPGVLSARYGEPGMGDAERAAHLLAAVADAGAGAGPPTANRDARFVCCLALVLDRQHVVTVQASVAGTLALRASGGGGFGYDPIFQVDASGRTMAELADAEKDAISHRGRALRACVRCIDFATGRLYDQAPQRAL